MKEVEVSKEFSCNMCSCTPPKKATVDGKTKLGSWAYMCENCYKIWGVGLGLGMGQRLILKEEIK